jgi:hypothetical protein
MELERLMAFMQRHGSSVLLNWGEDTGQWECSWITSGTRYTGLAGGALEAARDAYYHARAGVPSWMRHAPSIPGETNVEHAQRCARCQADGMHGISLRSEAPK